MNAGPSTILTSESCWLGEFTNTRSVVLWIPGWLANEKTSIWQDQNRELLSSAIEEKMFWILIEVSISLPWLPTVSLWFAGHQCHCQELQPAFGFVGCRSWSMEQARQVLWSVLTEVSARLVVDPENSRQGLSRNPKPAQFIYINLSNSCSSTLKKSNPRRLLWSIAHCSCCFKGLQL